LIQFQLNLSSTQNEPIATGTSYSVSLNAFDTASGATLQVTVAGSNVSDHAPAVTAGRILFGVSDATSPATIEPILIGASNSGNVWSFSNINGSSAFTITLANLSFFTRQGSTTSQIVDTAVTANGMLVTDYIGKIVSISPGYNSTLVPGHYFSTGSPAGQSGIDRRSNANLNSW